MALDSTMTSDKIKGMTGPKGGSKGPKKSAPKVGGKSKGGKY